MKNIVLFLLSAVLLLSCWGRPPHKLRMMTKERVVEYSDTDSVYSHYGYYKKVFRTYNYAYMNTTLSVIRIDENHAIDVFINEYGDTVSMIYVDYTNYPRREE